MPPLVPMLNTQLQERRERLTAGSFGYYSRNCLKLRTKGQGLQKMVLKKAQRYLDDRLEEQKQRLGYVRAIVLKGRQQGVSSYIQGRFVRRTTTNHGIRAFILTHEKDATENLFEMAERYYNNLPIWMRPELGKCNAKELSFDKLDSGYKIGTAGNKAVGRSQTIQLFHGSEVAFWPNAEEHTKGVLQAVPDEPDTEIILESTANGVGNYFHQQWKQAEKGLSDFIAVFIPWYWQEEYRRTPPPDFLPTPSEEALAQKYGLQRDQLYWRRQRILALDTGEGLQDGETAFKQEYPMNAAEAFQFSGGDTLITAGMCMRARVNEVDPHGPFIVGVDPSYGGDRFAKVSRMGRKMWGCEAYQGEQVERFSQRVSICHNILETVDETAGKKPDFMFIDAAVGRDIVDELHAMGHQNVRAVDFGIAPLYPDRFANKRNEIWGLFADWLGDEFHPPDIPDDDEFQADLTASPFRYDANERKCLRDKAFIIQEFGFSPDLGDAGALTFSFPIDLARNNVTLPKPLRPQGKVKRGPARLRGRNNARY